MSYRSRATLGDGRVSSTCTWSPGYASYRDLNGERRLYYDQLALIQLMGYLPPSALRRLVQGYRDDHRVRRFTCGHEFARIAFAWITFRESPRDIEDCLPAVPEKLYHTGLPGGVARNAFAPTNERRDLRIYPAVAEKVIAKGRRLNADQDLGLESARTVFALDSPTTEC